MPRATLGKYLGTYGPWVISQLCLGLQSRLPCKAGDKVRGGQSDPSWQDFSEAWD